VLPVSVSMLMLLLTTCLVVAMMFGIATETEATLGAPTGEVNLQPLDLPTSPILGLGKHLRIPV